MLFNTLWRAKRMEWVLSGVWQRLAGLHKMTRQLKELGPVLHFANLVASEMIHFVHQLSYYITFEVRPSLSCWTGRAKPVPSPGDGVRLGDPAEADPARREPRHCHRGAPAVPGHAGGQVAPDALTLTMTPGSHVAPDALTLALTPDHDGP